MLANIENWEELYKKLINAGVASQGFLYHYFQLLDINILEYDDRIRDAAFMDDKSLKSIEIPETITAIGYSAFQRSSLTNIVIPSSVMGIEENAFWDCTGLTSITFAEDSQLTGIGDSAFLGCTGLTSITIPNSVKSIKDYAFGNCIGLTSIEYQGTKAQWKAIRKAKDWDLNAEDYIIYCNNGEIKKK